MSFSLTIKQIKTVNAILDDLVHTSRILENQKYIQHGTTTVFEHCLSVAYFSLKFANLFHWKVDEASLIRGSLLHDYFLYDWHDKSTRVNPHGFLHPAVALKNAKEIYELNKKEEDIIIHHMFPLTLSPPRSREAFLVTIADKVCSIYETFKLNERKGGKLARKIKVYDL